MNDDIEDLDLPEDDEGEAIEAAPEDKPVSTRKRGRKVPMGEVDEAGYYIDPDPTFAKELSENEKAKLTDKAARTVQAQLKKKAQDDFLESEIARLQALAGVGKKQLGGHLDEQVTFTVNLEWEGSAYVQLDMPYGRKLHHGERVTLPRHKFNEVMYIMQAQRWQQAQFDGKNIFERRRHETSISAIDSTITFEPVH